MAYNPSIERILREKAKKEANIKAAAARLAKEAEARGVVVANTGMDFSVPDSNDDITKTVSDYANASSGEANEPQQEDMPISDAQNTKFLVANTGMDFSVTDSNEDIAKAVGDYANAFFGEANEYQQVTQSSYDQHTEFLVANTGMDFSVTDSNEDIAKAVGDHENASSGEANAFQQITQISDDQNTELLLENIVDMNYITPDSNEVSTKPVSDEDDYTDILYNAFQQITQSSDDQHTEFLVENTGTDFSVTDSNEDITKTVSDEDEDDYADIAPYKEANEFQQDMQISDDQSQEYIDASEF